MLSKSCSGFFKRVLSTPQFTECKRYLLQTTHYDILGLPKNCSKREIKDAFIKLSKRYHPDKNTTNSSHKQFIRVLEAYSILSKPDSRRYYDWQLSRGTVDAEDDVPQTPRSRPSGYGYDDPSFWRNRDKSYDDHYSYEPYYGVRGINRVSNRIIALVCVVVTVIGGTLQYFAIRHSVTLKREALLRKSMENEHVLAKLQADALKNGNQLQLELMEQSFKKNKYYTAQNQEKQRYSRD